MPSPNELTNTERSARRCAICHTGRRPREFELVARDGQEPILMCPACRARFGAQAPLPVAQPAAPPEPAPTAAEPPAAKQDAPKQANPKQPSAPSEDRLKKALRELPHGEHSVGRIAKAAGLNPTKTLSRLHALKATGDVQQVGKRWSNEPPSTDVEAAMDRLQARTSNLRIVRERRPVG